MYIYSAIAHASGTILSLHSIHASLDSTLYLDTSLKSCTVNKVYSKLFWTECFNLKYPSGFWTFSLYGLLKLSVFPATDLRFPLIAALFETGAAHSVMCSRKICWEIFPSWSQFKVACLAWSLFHGGSVQWAPWRDERGPLSGDLQEVLQGLPVGQGFWIAGIF